MDDRASTRASQRTADELEEGDEAKKQGRAVSLAENPTEHIIALFSTTRPFADYMNACPSDVRAASLIASA